jgi:hypothetical protein
MDFNRFERRFYIELTADAEWTFALFSKVNGPDDVQEILSFRNKQRTEFGFKELRGTAGWWRNVIKLVNNIIAKKALRRSLLSNDPELEKMWKRTRS